MDIGNRIKKIRKEFDLTQTEFAARIGSVQNTVARYESNQRNPSSSVITLICEKFGVREEWLRNGEGAMMKPEPVDALDQLAKDYELSNADYMMIKEFINLRPDARKIIYDYISNVKFPFEDGKMDPLAPASMEKEITPPEISVEQAEAEYKKDLQYCGEKGIYCFEYYRRHRKSGQRVKRRHKKGGKL